MFLLMYALGSLGSEGESADEVAPSWRSNWRKGTWKYREILAISNNEYWQAWIQIPDYGMMNNVRTYGDVLHVPCLSEPKALKTRKTK